ncbi:hypothetical protein AC7_A0083 [Clostridium perfringens NCTC 8239]|nr:hypothetical protein AC7_A0083 [Clostridium perfringens NCTC 8239]
MGLYILYKIIEIVQTNFYIVKINVLDLFAFRRIKNGKT